MNESFPEIDLYALYLLRLVAKYRGFTAASNEAGISQSALTRQVQGVESRLGVKIFDRTTRAVALTEPGAILLRETEAIPNILTGALRRIQEEYLEAPLEIRIGISQSLALAHIPGLFHIQQKAYPEVKVLVSQVDEETTLNQLAVNQLDLAILTKPKALSDAVIISHEMEDQFCVVAPSEMVIPEGGFREWAAQQNWLLPPSGSATRRLIDVWAKRQRVNLRGAMELENFDLVNQFVALGMGVAFVPRRSLSGWVRKHRLQRVSIPSELVRKLVILRSRHGSEPEHVSDFVEGILFS